MVQLAIQSPIVDSTAGHSERSLASAAEGRSGIEQACIRVALECARKAHYGQYRASGEDYLNHTMAVAGLLHELRLDTYALIAGLLHDTVEDTEVSSADLRENFGVIVSRLVDGVTKM